MICINRRMRRIKDTYYSEEENGGMEWEESSVTLKERSSGIIIPYSAYFKNHLD